MSVIVLSEQNFDEEVKKSDKKVLVDFYADWCGPCKMLEMILQDIEDIEIVKVDIDRFRNIAKEYKVLSIPSLKIFSNGEIIKEKIGFMTRDELQRFINE